MEKTSSEKNGATFGTKPGETDHAPVMDALAQMMQQSFERSSRILADSSNIARKNAAAAMAASNAASRGIQTLAQQTTEQSGKSLENILHGMQNILESRTAKEAIAAQQAFLQSTAGTNVAALSNLGQTLVKTASDILTPWNGLMLAAVESCQKASPRTTDA